MADKTVRYAPLQEAAKHTEVRQVSNPCHSLHPAALCIERLLPMPVQGVARTGSYSSPSYLTYMPWPR